MEVTICVVNMWVSQAKVREGMTSQGVVLGRLPCIYKYRVILLEINLHSTIICIITISPHPHHYHHR